MPVGEARLRSRLRDLNPTPLPILLQEGVRQNPLSNPTPNPSSGGCQAESTFLLEVRLSQREKFTKVGVINRIWVA